MLRIQARDLGTCALSRQGPQLEEERTELLFCRLIVLRPGLGGFQYELKRPGFAQPLRNPRVSLGRIGEPLPDLLPAGLAPPEALGRGDNAIGLRVETIVSLGLLYERRPSLVAYALFERLRIVNPVQQVLDRVGIDQRMKEVRVELLVLDPIDRVAEELIQRKQHRLCSLRIVGDLQSQAVLGIGTERANGPILSILMREPLPPILQLGYRRQRRRAGLNGTERPSICARHVDDRRSVGLVHLDGPGNHATHPVRRALAGGGVVVTQAKQRDTLQKARNDRLPLPRPVGPEQCDRRNLSVLVERKRIPEPLDEAVETRCRSRPHPLPRRLLLSDRQMNGRCGARSHRGSCRGPSSSGW